MPSLDEYRFWDREHVWHAFSQMQSYEPLLIERAEGCTLFDVDGRALLDGASSLWCNLHGHAHPRLDAAVCGQLAKVAHVTSLGMGNLPAAELAHRLAELAPAGLRHVFFSGDGACAIEAALKLAFQYWRQTSPARPAKRLFVSFDDAYHGDTLGSASVGGVARFHEMFRPLLFETLRLPAPDTYRLPAGVSPDAACAAYLASVEQLLRERSDEIAAVILEPLMQCAAGMLAHPPGFLRGVRELTRQHDVLLICDEVAVGFGRTGRMFACEHEQVTPDLLCLGKGLTAGYLPMSATLATPEIWQAFLGDHRDSRTFYHGHTYAGNPLAAAVALASLDIFRDEQVLALLPAKIDALRGQLARLAEHPLVGDVRQCGLLGGVELVRNRDTREPFPWSERVGSRVCTLAMRDGVWLRPLGDVIPIIPPLAIREEELAQIGHALWRALDDVARQV